MDEKTLQNVCQGLQNAGMTPAHFIALCASSLPECQMRSISKAMGMSSAAATGSIDRLEDLGFVSRSHSAEDRRVVLVKLTLLGKEAIERTLQTVNDQLSVN